MAAIDMHEVGEAGALALRARIERNVMRASAQRVRALFAEINPQLVGDRLFEERWSNVARKDAAVLVPIVARAEPTVLLTVRSSDMPSHAGQISFPGGKIHADDAGPVGAALREAQEEANIAPEFVDVVGALGVHQGGLGFSVTPVIGIVDPAADFRACPREVAEIFEAPLAYFADLANHVTVEKELNGVKYNMFAAPWRGYHIWGLTAGILRSLADTLQDEG